jgi:hypothetical protein
MDIKIRRIAVQGQPVEKVIKTLFSANKLSMVASFLNSSYVGGIGCSITVQGPGRKCEMYPKKVPKTKTEKG